MTEPVFVSEGEQFVPTVHARGPWDPQALHGGAPAALLARAVERVPSPVPMRVTRMTFEILTPVPMAPLTLDTAVVREGRRVQIVEASVSAGGRAVVRARALRIRTEPTTERIPDPVAPADPETIPSWEWTHPLGNDDGFGATTMEMRFASGTFETLGPAAAWFRLRRPLVDDEPLTPLQRVMAAGDFGNGISGVLDWGRYVFINPDLSVSLVREPIGEWVLIDASTQIEPDGVGLATAQLSDHDGPIGVAVQSLYVATR